MTLQRYCRWLLPLGQEAHLPVHPTPHAALGLNK